MQQSTSFFPTSAEAPVFPSFSRSLSKRKIDETYTEEEEAQMMQNGGQQQGFAGDASDGHVQKQIRPLPNLSLNSPFDPCGYSSTSSPASSSHYPDTPSFEIAPSWNVHHQFSSLSTTAAARTEEERERGMRFGDDDEVDEEEMAMFIASIKGKGGPACGEDAMMGGMQATGGLREHGPMCTSAPSIVLSNPNPSGERSLWAICRDCGNAAPA